MKKTFPVKMIRSLSLTLGMLLFFTPAGCISADGEMIEPASEQAAPRPIFPVDRSAYADVQSWRTSDPDPLMLELRGGGTDKLRLKNADAYISEVAKVINENAGNDFQKVKMINDIVALTLDYDVDAYLSRKIPRQKYSDVLSKGRAVSDGFSAVFLKLCDATGIKCRSVRGYARGASTSLDKESSVTLSSNHTWNIVTIGEKDYLVDVTWNGGYMSGDSTVKEYGTDWLFACPESFIYTHFPESASDQLLEEPVSRGEFLCLPDLRPAFFDEVVRWEETLGRIVSCEGSLSYDFTQLNKDIGFSCSVRSVESSQDAENAFHFVQGISPDAKLYLSFPEAGLYKVQLFANHPEKAVYLGSFLVSSTSAGTERFPQIFSNYGLAKDGIVETPVFAPLKKGSEVSFTVRTPKSFVAVLIDDSAKDKVEWNYLENKGKGVFEGSVMIPETATRLRVSVKETGGRNFWSIAEYELE